MADGNPIRFSDLFNFSDQGDTQSAADLIKTLNTNYKEFIETVMGSSVNAFTNQTKEIAETAKNLADQIVKVKTSTKEGQEALIGYTEALGQQEIAAKNVIAAKKGLKEAETVAADSVAGLTAKYKELKAQYDLLSPAEKMQEAQMKTLSMAGQDCKDKITALNNAFKTTTDVVKAAAGSYAALEKENKLSIIALKNMGGALEGTNPAAKLLQEQIAQNTIKLKEFDAQILVFNRNVGNYFNDIKRATELQTQMKEVTDRNTIGFKQMGSELNDINARLGKVTSSVIGFRTAGNTLAQTTTQVQYLTAGLNDLAAAGKMDTIEFREMIALLKQIQHAAIEAGECIKEGLVEAAEKGVEQLKELFVTFFLLNEVINFFEGIKEEVEKAERATVQLQNTLEMFGKGDQLEGVIKKVEELRDKFKYLGEAELNVAFDKLITYAKLSEEQIDELMPVIINYAAKQKQTIEESTAVFLRALEGQGRGLKELGINVKDGANEIERLGIIMDQLAPKVAGAADAFEKSDSGKVAGFTRKIKDLQKEIGEFLIPVLGALAGVLSLLPLGPITVALGLLTAAMIAQYTWTKLTTEGTVLYNLVQKGKIMWDALATSTQIAYTQALVLFTGETRAATAAQLAFNAAEAANPLTALIAVIAIATAAIYAYSTRVTQMTKAVNAQAEADLRAAQAKKVYNEVHLTANRAVSEEIAAVNKLVDVIKHHSNTLDERNKALDKLVALNRENLAGLTLENIETEKGIEILDRYIKKLEETAYAEALQSKLLELEKERVENKLNKPKEIESGAKGDEDPAMAAAMQRRAGNINDINEAQFKKKDEEIEDKINAILDEIKLKGNPDVHNKSDYETGTDHTQKDARSQLESDLKYLEEFTKKRDNVSKLAFENSKKYASDEANLTSEELQHARDGYALKLSYLEEYHRGAGKLDKKYSEDKLKLDNELKVAEIRATQENNKILDKLNSDYSKYEARLKANQEKIAEAEAKMKDLGVAAKFAAADHKEDLKDEKKNPVLALFGLDDPDDINAPFQKKDRDLKYQRTKLLANYEKEAKKPIAGDYTLSTKNANLSGINADLTANDNDLQKNKDDHELAQLKKKEDAKAAIEKASFELSQNLEKTLFDVRQNNLKQQMANLQAQSQFELQLAGNNNAGRIKIERETQQKMLALKRQAAQLAKDEAMVSALLDAAKGVAAATAVGPPADFALIPIAISQGLAAVAAVSKIQLPSYFTGRGKGKDEWARVNELGPELIERDGTFRFAGGGRETITPLAANDIVHTHKETIDIIHKDKWLDNLLSGTGVYRQLENEKQYRQNIPPPTPVIDNKGIDKIVAAIREQPQPEQIPGHVFDKHMRQLLRHNL